ncbi:MAG: hypothetical protein H6828_12330 [Planctomycetes bacterium]|nr:hypothetical protein [Planctomycetota bacterium]
MRLVPSALLLALALPLAACHQEVGAQGPEAEHAAQAATQTTDAQAEAPRDPDYATVATRAQRRWDEVTAGEWMQAYDYVPPSVRKYMSLDSFLSGKTYHEYKNPTKPVLIAQDGDEAYIELTVVWEPHHPQIQTANNLDGQSLEQEVHMVETWMWEENEWYLKSVERHNEFLTAHPKIAKELAK